MVRERIGERRKQPPLRAAGDGQRDFRAVWMAPPCTPMLTASAMLRVMAEDPASSACRDFESALFE
jgi:hypothetical protein